MTTDELVRRRDYLRYQTNNVAISYHKIKSNPMDLNLLMEHIGLLSLTVDGILTDMANDIDVALNKETDVVAHYSDDIDNHQNAQ